MILSDRYRFVFAHVPKCAGSYVRNTLAPYDDTDGRFSGREQRQPFLGIWHYAHIPLCILQQYFPSEFERLQIYRSFALFRDPFDRFPSSIAQRVKQYRGMPLHTLSQADIQSEVDVVISCLSQQDEITDPSYIHFVRQSDYLELKGERVIQNLYSVRNVSIMLRDIGELVGETLEGLQQNPAINQTDVYRHEGLRRIIEAVRPILNDTILELLPESAKKHIRRFLYVPREQKTNDIFRSDSIKSFVREYYRRDFEVAKWVKQRDNEE